MPTLYTMVAPCFFGTESTLNFEVKRLGAQNIQVTDGRVAFQGGADIIAAALPPFWGGGVQKAAGLCTSRKPTPPQESSARYSSTPLFPAAVWKSIFRRSAGSTAARRILLWISSACKCPSPSPPGTAGENR